MVDVHAVGQHVRGLHTAAQSRMGRKRDHSRDADILDAALEVLVETGYEGMTIDMVAARAKAGKATLYRRWPSKAELVIDAVACMKQGELDPALLHDTGTLRGDLIAMIKTPTIEEGERKLRLMAGLASLIARSPELAETARTAIVEPRIAVNRMFLQRARDRGEISADADLELAAMVGPAMVAYRVLMLRTPSNREFMTALIDNVILPVVGIRPA
jgi:AcrR family transcriptional regulator